MNRRAEIKRLYKETKPEAGVYQIKNTQNGKLLVCATPNLKTMNGRRFQLNAGNHPNPLLQQEWNHYGEKAFVFEVLEVLKENEEEKINQQEALQQLEDKWLSNLQPFGERGYHREQTR